MICTLNCRLLGLLYSSVRASTVFDNTGSSRGDGVFEVFREASTVYRDFIVVTGAVDIYPKETHTAAVKRLEASAGTRRACGESKSWSQI